MENICRGIISLSPFLFSFSLTALCCCLHAVVNVHLNRRHNTLPNLSIFRFLLLPRIQRILRTMANSCSGRSFQIRHGIAELLRSYIIRIPLLPRSLVYTRSFPSRESPRSEVYRVAFSLQNEFSLNPVKFIKIIWGSYVQLCIQGFPG